ncbi:MAG: adenylyl-sulfate reductase [Thioalkalivibrio sp.]|nr:adenylyl-sulfate reductase [Thioalkalivibrio sp.]
MLTSNPVADVSAMIPPLAMQIYIIAMLVLVVAGTIFDVIHKKSAKYFFENAEKAKKSAQREVAGGDKVSIALKTAGKDVLTSGEFCNQKRRAAHLLTMYGFIIFVITSVVLVFGYPTTAAPALVALLWHIGALLVAAGGLWFWFFIRVDVAAEGHPWYRVIRGDLFVLSLLATTIFALVWSFLQWIDAGAWATLFFWVFVLSSLVLFGGVPWSKFAHMFFKPMAAYQRRTAEEDGSMDNLPPPADKPEQFGLGMSARAPRNY